MHIFAKETFYFTASSGYRNIRSDWTDCIFTPIKELYKSSSALNMHS